jgi:hypothetical protein
MVPSLLGVRSTALTIWCVVASVVPAVGTLRTSVLFEIDQPQLLRSSTHLFESLLTA